MSRSVQWFMLTFSSSIHDAHVTIHRSLTANLEEPSAILLSVTIIHHNLK
jgi:hypothetical protein